MSRYSKVMAGIHTALAALNLRDAAGNALPIVDAYSQTFALAEARRAGRRSILLLYNGEGPTPPHPLGKLEQNLSQSWTIIVFDLNFQKPADLLELMVTAEAIQTIRGTVLTIIDRDSVRLMMAGDSVPADISADTGIGGEFAVTIPFRTSEYYG